MSKKTALLKQLKVGYFNPDNKIIDRFKLEVETYLKYMFEVQITEFHEMLGSDLSIYDLILADARFVETNFFLSWLKQFSKKMKTNKNIWTPALIMSQLTFEEETKIFKEVYFENWYFDIVQEQHISSIPIRMANLMRSSEHLKELIRYQDILESLQKM